MKQYKMFLSEDDVPRQWYNIQADLPSPLQPIIHPATGKPIGPEDLAPVFPMNLIEQEVSQQRWIDIPEEVMEKLLIWRPLLFSVPMPWKRPWGPLRGFTTKMKE